MSEQFDGRWERRGLVMVPVAYARPADPPEPPLPPTNARRWSDARLRRHHADFIRGERDPRTIAGHREWMRRYKARKRAEQRQERQAG